MTDRHHPNSQTTADDTALRWPDTSSSSAPGDRLLTVPEVADVLRLGRTKIYELLASGSLRSVHVGSARRVLASDLQGFIASLGAGGEVQIPRQAS